MVRKYGSQGLVFLSAPYRCDPVGAKRRMELIELFLEKEFPELDFFTPHLHSDQWKATATAKKDPRPLEAVAMTNCIINLSKCNEIWLCGPHIESSGMLAEIAYARAVGIPIVGRDYLWQKAIEPDFIAMCEAVREEDEPAVQTELQFLKKDQENESSYELRRIELIPSQFEPAPGRSECSDRRDDRSEYREAS